MNERWLPIGGFENFYEVSSLGRVKSLARRIVRRDGVPQTYRNDRILRPRLSATGHLSVSLRRVDHGSVQYVHRLVMAAFAGPCPEGLEVLHRDGDPANNRRTNLHYGTHTENMHDKREHGTQYQSSMTHCSAGHEFNNINARTDSAGRRWCRLCHNMRNAEHRERLRAA